MGQDEADESPAIRKARHDLRNRESAWSLTKQLTDRTSNPQKKVELEALVDQRSKELEKAREDYEQLVNEESRKTPRK